MVFYFCSPLFSFCSKTLLLDVKTGCHRTYLMSLLKQDEGSILFMLLNFHRNNVTVLFEYSNFYPVNVSLILKQNINLKIRNVVFLFKMYYEYDIFY